MALTGNWLLIRRILTTALYKLLRLVFITVQSIFWRLNGTARKVREARLPHNYERSAQVLDVLLVHCFGHATTTDSFICTHNRFEHPQYIIDNDNITLMTVSDHDAVFGEPARTGMHLWRSEYSSFLRSAQLQFCRRLIVVPLSTFHRTAELIGDPAGQLIFISHTSRCGSTLLTQMMESTRRCVALSEPQSTVVVATKYRRKSGGDSSELRQLARDVIRWECRPYTSLEVCVGTGFQSHPTHLAGRPIHVFYPSASSLCELQRVIDIRLDEAANLCIQFNTKKCSVIRFGPKYHSQCSDIAMLGSSLKFVNPTKLFGVTRNFV